MVAVRIIPCLDVRDGVVVKGVRFSNLREFGRAAEHAAQCEAEGADEVVILDVTATLERRISREETINQVRRELSIPLTCGGGIRSVADAEAMLEAGADKVSLNTAAVQSPELISAVAERFGKQCTVLAIDARSCEGSGEWEVLTHSGKHRAGRQVLEWAKEGVERGAGEILLTSWDRDGTGSGYDCELLRALCTAVNVPVIASGGAKTAEHCAQAVRAGAAAVLAASIFHERLLTINQLKEQLLAFGVTVRV